MTTEEKTLMKSFRFRTSDFENLKKISKSVNEIKKTGRKINETDIVKGLLLIGLEIKPEKLLNKIKEIF